jgi:methylglutaconyl-CoA hydratase
MEFIQHATQDRIAYITLNRPDKRNALSFGLVKELKETLALAEHDPDVKVIILQANGDAFCAGADLAYLQDLQKFSYEENLADSRHLKALFLQIYTLKKVVIASIQGAALAGGCGLASVCDFSFAVPEAKFAYTEVKIGFIPAIVLVFLLRKVGEGRAKQLLLTGDIISAHEAQSLGLINFISSPDKLKEDVKLFAEKLVLNASANSLAVTKNMIGKVQELALEEALDYACEMNAKARASEDCKKGISAFLNKEKLRW